MIFSRLGLGAARPSAERIAFALGRPTPPREGRLGRFARRPPRPCAGDRLYFAVRSVAASAREHVLQYAFADDRGNVAASVFARSPSPVALVLATPPHDLAVEPMEAGAVDELVSRICRGARLVTFHRVLQAGLLPPAGLAAAGGVECAWRRFQRVAHTRGLRVDRGAPLSLADCLAQAGLAPPPSEDAALRALSVGELWRWMDEVE
ncbi:MAG: hypothetical protein ACK4YQ_00815 [Phenylobacterium sp.]|uniref:hypothetical protein n=1 Tax=Phenylobacterium sp. TaxID=1871053 RepID=UPI00391A6E81